MESERIVGIAGAIGLTLSLSSALSILSQNRASGSAILVQGQVLNTSRFRFFVFSDLFDVLQYIDVPCDPVLTSFPT